jgi:hypothetical protein
MSQDNQSRNLESFFATLPGVSQSTCHRVAAQLLSPHGEQPVKIEPAPLQGSRSYTCVAAVPCGTSSLTIIQFRREESNLESLKEAHAIHGNIVPPVTFHGVHDRLFVYMSPFAQGEPYINILMSPEGEPALSHRIRTARDFASVFVRFSKDSRPSANTQSILSNLEIDSLSCQTATKQLITRCVAMLQGNIGLIHALPCILAHSDLVPENLLVEPTTGNITAVIDWSGATVERVGHNLHFAEHLFGCMTLDSGWMDYSDRKAVEEVFRSRLREVLLEQGVDDPEKLLYSMELSKAVGILQYYIPRMKRNSDSVWEEYLVTFLRQLTWEQFVG